MPGVSKWLLQWAGLTTKLSYPPSSGLGHRLGGGWERGASRGGSSGALACPFLKFMPLLVWGWTDTASRLATKAPHPLAVKSRHTPQCAARPRCGHQSVMRLSRYEARERSTAVGSSPRK